MYKEKLAIIIPTKDRIDKLFRLLEDIAQQAFKPDQIIVIDGGEEEARNVINKFPQLYINYYRKTPASLTVQRNIGIEKVDKDITLVAFFDDDIVLEDNCFENMMFFWENASDDVAGASFNNMNHSFKRPSFFEALFMAKAQKPGRIMRSGFQNLPCSLEQTTEVDWMIGCCMVFRKEILNHFKFDEWFDGYAHCEDVDFCYRVSRKFKLFTVAEAKIKHLAELEKPERSYNLGRMQIVNRIYFVKKHPALSVPFCYWACFGLWLNNFVKGFFKKSERHMLRAKGNVAGFKEVFGNNFEQNSKNSLVK